MTAEQPEVEFFDSATNRQMKLVMQGEWRGWLFFKHPDGQWISLRKASENDLQTLGRRGVIWYV